MNINSAEEKKRQSKWRVIIAQLVEEICDTSLPWSLDDGVWDDLEEDIFDLVRETMDKVERVPK